MRISRPSNMRILIFIFVTNEASALDHIVPKLRIYITSLQCMYYCESYDRFSLVNVISCPCNWVGNGAVVSGSFVMLIKLEN
jgi:hypothetical protein